MELTVKWHEKMAFSSMTPSGHELKMDASLSVGGENTGARPTELLLSALAGCTGIDVMSILTKMRLSPTSFEMNVQGERAKEHPKRFTNIHIHYVFTGDLPEDKVIRAITLSKNKYCTVAHSLQAEISASYTINGEEGKENIV